LLDASVAHLGLKPAADPLQDLSLVIGGQYPQCRVVANGNARASAGPTTTAGSSATVLSPMILGDLGATGRLDPFAIC